MTTRSVEMLTLLSERQSQKNGAWIGVRPNTETHLIDENCIKNLRPHDTRKEAEIRREDALAYGFTGSGFFAQTEHQPPATTSLPPKAAHGPLASPALP